MRKLLIISLLLNSLLFASIGFMMQRLGGWKYAFYRFWHTETGLYEHRRSLFKTLPHPRNAVIFIGDSQIEQCEWSELLALGPDVPVLNRGIVGDQADGVLARLHDDVIRIQPAKVFLCVGVNDLLLDKSPRSIEQSYRDIARKFRINNREGQLYLISVLPVNNDVKKIGVSNEQIAELNLLIQQIARDYSMPYIDLAAKLSDENGNLLSKFTSDGIHLNGDGYAVWKKMVLPFLEKK